MQLNPFKRAIMMQAAIAAILANGMPLSMQQLELRNMPAYKSRGHGKGKPGRKIKAQQDWKSRQAGFRHGCGKKECARRVSQMAKLQNVSR